VEEVVLGLVVEVVEQVDIEHLFLEELKLQLLFMLEQVYQ
jgi:hypothetical protein